MPHNQYGTPEKWQTNHGNIGILENIQKYHQNLPVTEHSLSQLPEKFYKIGDYIGNETRQFEFKEGQGIVVGIRCNHQKKDKLGLLISAIMRSELDPPVVPQQYSVRFVPVCDEQGVNQINDRYVLEIAVYRLFNNITELYKASGEVFRRDEGCLNGPLRSDEKTKWLKLLHQIESESNQNQFNPNQSYIQRLKETKEKLEEEKEQLEKEKEQMASDMQLKQRQLQEQYNVIKQKKRTRRKRKRRT